MSASCAHNNTAIRRWTTLVADVRQINERFHLIFSDQTYRSYTSCFLTKESRKALLLQLMHVSLFLFFSILIMTCDNTKRDTNVCMKTIFNDSCHFQKNNIYGNVLSRTSHFLYARCFPFSLFFQMKELYRGWIIEILVGRNTRDNRRASNFPSIKLEEFECGNTGMSRHEDRREPRCVVSVHVSSAQKLYSIYLTRFVFSAPR